MLFHDVKVHASASTLAREDQLAWKVRAALRLARWDVVRETIDLMPTSTRHESAWTYWYGRALAAQGKPAYILAYPAEYRSSGVMTFVVTAKGVVYEKDLGANTSTLASSMATFRKDATWRAADE